MEAEQMIARIKAAIRNFNTSAQEDRDEFIVEFSAMMATRNLVK